MDKVSRISRSPLSIIYVLCVAIVVLYSFCNVIENKLFTFYLTVVIQGNKYIWGHDRYRVTYSSNGIKMLF